jgi:hypothetical protein
VLEETTTIKITHPESKKSWSFQRRQLPILPAFAITDYKAQGKTLPYVIIDLQSCHNIQSAYVMISRATSLDGLLILRPFQPKKVQCHVSQEFRRDSLRLHILSLKTILRTPSQWEKHEHATNDLPSLEKEASRLDDIINARSTSSTYKDTPFLNQNCSATRHTLDDTDTDSDDGDAPRNGVPTKRSRSTSQDDSKRTRRKYE